MSIAVHFPTHYRIVLRDETTLKWTVEGAKATSPDTPIGMEGVSKQFGITNLALVASLFRINGGRAGYYATNLRDKKYYYCGLTLEDVRDKLLNLGIAQPGRTAYQSKFASSRRGPHNTASAQSPTNL